MDSSLHQPPQPLQLLTNPPPTPTPPPTPAAIGDFHHSSQPIKQRIQRQAKNPIPAKQSNKTNVALAPELGRPAGAPADSGEDGQLGMGDWEDEDRSCAINSLDGYPVTVVSGSRNSLAICDNGHLFYMGWNQRGTLGHPPETKKEGMPGPVKALADVKIVQAAIGEWHCLAVDDQGRAYAWGGNEYGQCGEEPERKEEGIKALRRDIPIPQHCAPKLSVCQVAVGGTHSIVLTQDGQVWSWGQPWPPGDIK